MALGSNITNGTLPASVGAVYPASLTMGWTTIIDAGGLAVLDNALITNPTTQITSSTRHILLRNASGTNLIVRMKYDSTLVVSASPVIKVFGRVGTDAWQTLYSKGGNLVETISADTTNDARDGTFNYTTPNFVSQSWDCLGCEELLVGIQTILAGTVGSVATATLQAKVV